MLSRLKSLWRVLTRRADFERNMNEELRFHVDQYTEDLIRAGVSREEAARRAHIEFGARNRFEEECREARGLRVFDELSRQVRFAGRALRKTPAFTAAALMTLAVCLGANLTIFAVVDAVLVRPLPFRDADRLVTIFNTYPKAGVERDGSSIANYYERRGRIPALSSLAIYSYVSAIVGEGASERAQAMRVSPEFFETLGTAPKMGRSFTDDETSFQTDKVVILADAYWRERFQADPNVIGKSLRVDDLRHTIVGVLPPGFRFLSSEARLYLPFSSIPEYRGPAQRHAGGNSKHIVARLKPGATLEQAQAQIDARNAALVPEDPKAAMLADAGFRSVLRPLHADHVAGVGPALWAMQAGAVLLLLIGAVNLTNLLLIRASSRTKEIAVRQALGAGRFHIAAGSFVEITLVALAGGLLGLLAGAGGIRLLAFFGADRLPLGSEIAFDARLAWLGVAGSVVLGLMLATPIVWFHLRRQLGGALQSETRGGTAGRAAQRLRHVFVMGQVALAMVLLAGAGLLALSLERTMAISPGFRPDSVQTGQLSVPWQKYSTWTARLAYNERILRELAGQPGVAAAGVVSNVPFSGNSGKSSSTVKGYQRRPGEAPRGNYSYGVDGDYFQAMGFVLRAGRFLTADDSRRATRVCVVDEDFARYYWPGGNAIGQRLFMGPEERRDADAFTVVGVVGAVKQIGLTEDVAQGAIYYPYALASHDGVFVVVRANLPPEALASTLQRVARRVDADVPLHDIRSMDRRISDSLVPQRSPAMVAAIFSVIALLLTAVGVYGVLSYSVAQRRREIGVRMALGARPQQIRRQFLMVASRLLAAGVALGILGAWLTGQAMRTLLFRVPPVHWPTFVAAAGVIALVSVAACLLPAHRASRISPTEALTEQ